MSAKWPEEKCAAESVMKEKGMRGVLPPSPRARSWSCAFTFVPNLKDDTGVPET